MWAASLVQILRSLHATLVAQFWPSWLVLTAAAVSGSTWIIGRPASPGEQRRDERHLIPVWPRVATPAGIVALGILVVFIVSYIAIILVWEDFAYMDNSIFTLVTLKGHDIPLFIEPEVGRFFPLGLQEFNLIRHFTESAIGYHVLPIAELLIFVSILLVLNDELGIAARVALAILALLTPSILISFGGLIFPERNELLFLAGLILCVKRFEESESTRWAAGAVLCAQIMVYYKENAFLLLLGFAGARLLLRCRSGRLAGWDYDRLRDRLARLDWSLVGVAILFLLYYFGAAGLHPNVNYAIAYRQPFVGMLLAYTRRDVLVWLLVVVAAGRIYLILRRRAASLPLWDGLAIGGVAYFLAYLYLRIYRPWYSAPVDLIAVLYAGRFAVLLLGRTRLWRKSIILMLVSIVVFQNVVFSAVSIFERKNAIHGKVEIARVVGEQYRMRTAHPLRLFFPFAAPYSIMEFAAYLSYRGIPVEGANGADAGPERAVLAGRAVAKDGPCMVYHTIIRCLAADRPAPGDLVIVLPDDGASRAQASPYRARGELFSYEPRPSVFRHALVADLAGDLRITIPDRWMDGSVGIWQ